MFPDLQVGQQWEVPVYVSTGGEPLTAFDITIKLSSQHFALNACTSFEVNSCGDAYSNYCWPGYEFFCNTLPLLDGFRMIGQKADNKVIKGRVRLATISVTATAASAGALPTTGSVAVLTVFGKGNQVASGQGVFAGQGLVTVRGGRRAEEATSPPSSSSSRSLGSSCSDLQGLHVSDMNGDGELNVLDSALLLEKYVRGTNEACACDPTFNGRTDLNDFNLLSLATVTGLLVLDRSATLAEVQWDYSLHIQVLVARVWLRCSGCAPQEGCIEHSAAFAATSVTILLDTRVNWQLSGVAMHGSSTESAASGLVVATTEHMGDGLYELRLQRQQGEAFDFEQNAQLAVHEYKGTRRWGWNDDSADMSTSSVRAAHVFSISPAEPTHAPLPTPAPPPTAAPTRQPTASPPTTAAPTVEPQTTPQPTKPPTGAPTRPAGAPMVEPQTTPQPTRPPTGAPTRPPTRAPTQPPAAAPTAQLAGAPTVEPQTTPQPSRPPTGAPTRPPTRAPTPPPTRAPTPPPTDSGPCAGGRGHHRSWRDDIRGSHRQGAHACPRHASAP